MINLYFDFLYLEVGIFFAANIRVSYFPIHIIKIIILLGTYCCDELQIIYQQRNI